MRRALKRIVGVSLALFVVLALAGAAFAWWATRDSSLQWLVERVGTIAGGSVRTEGLRGSLLAPIAARRIVFENDDVRVQADGVAFAWRSWTSFVTRRSIELTEASIAALVIEQKRSSAERGRPPESLELPISLRADRLAVDRIELRMLAGTTVMSAVRVAYHYDRAVPAEPYLHSVRLASLESEYGIASGDLTLADRVPFDIGGAFTLRNPRSEFPYQLDLTLGGVLTQIGLGVSARVDFGEARAAAVLQPYERPLVDRIVASAENLDPRRVRREWPEARLTVALVGGLDTAGRFVGTLAVDNAIAGPIDRARLPFTRLATGIVTDATAATLREIEMLDGTARVTGRGAIDRTRLQLDLSGTGLDAARIDSRLRATRLAGEVSTELAAARQTAKGRLTQAATGSLPPIQLDFDLTQASNAIDVRAFTLAVARGTLKGDGRIALSADNAFKLAGTAREFDPSTIATVPAASLSGTFAAEGVLRPLRRIDAKFVVADSRWRGFALAGRGDVGVEGERVTRGNAQLELVGNRVELAGAFGAPGDALRWTLDAPRLDALGLPVAGRVRSNGVLTGTAQAPQAEFSAEGDRLRSTITAGTGTPAWEVGVFSATGRYGGTAGEARVTARTLRAGGLRFVDAALDAKGSLTEHTLALNARADAGSPFETIVATLAGGWDAPANRWRGTIERARTEGKLATSLTAPARLELSAERVRLDEAELEFAGGRVAIASLERSAANGALASAGTFKDLAAATLAEWAGRLPGETRIGLLLGGAWQLRLDDALSGTLRVSRQSGDLSILGARDAADARRAERRAFGLEQFELLLTAERNRLDARLQAGGARIGQLDATVRTQLSQRQGTWGIAGTAPLEGRVTLAGASLALARVFAPDSVRIDGQLAGAVTLAGTVGTPRLGGALDLTRGRIDIPDEGLRLRDGTAVIKLEGDAARIESARFAGESGTLSASGVLGWSGGAPAGELIFTLAGLDAVTDPTYDLALTGAVNARIRGPAIGLSGKVRADRGVIRLPESDTPVVSKDVVVRGRPQVATDRASGGGSGGGLPATDLVVDLGDKFTVKGRGVDAQITGTLALRGGERQPLRVNGVVRSDKGTVSAYGQTLAIERGTMTFTGPPDNPTLNVIAVRPNLSQRVGVQVTGFALEPRVALFADTAMPESEKLAWLVLGRSTDGLGPTDLAVLGTAASALLGGPATQPLTNKLAALVGLDEIAVRRGEDSQGTIVSVGKRLSDRLVLSVESGLQGLGAAVRLRYQVSSRWSVETRTGTSSTVNMFYSLSFD